MQPRTPASVAGISISHRDPAQTWALGFSGLSKRKPVFAATVEALAGRITRVNHQALLSQIRFGVCDADILEEQPRLGYLTTNPAHII